MTQKDPNHWIADEDNRRAFWAKVKDEFGLTEAQVHEALGVESLYETTHERAVAESQLRWYAKGMNRSIAQEMDGLKALAEFADSIKAPDAIPEAVASLNTFACTPEGYNLQLTLRDVNEGALLLRFSLLSKTLATLSIFPCNRHGDPVLPRSVVEKAFQEQAVHDQAKGAPPIPPGLTAPPAPGSSSPPGGTGTEPPGTQNGSVIQTEFIKITAPKGKPVIEFWRPNRQYAEIRHNLGAEDLLKKSPKLAEAGWTVEHFAIGQEYTVPLNVHWVPSTNLDSKGNPYKNIARVEPR